MRVYFSKEMTSDAQSYSPSAGKPSLVAADWVKAGLDVEFKKPIPVSGKTIAQAHDENYVQGVLNCTRTNGFGNTSESVAKSLPYTVGAMVSATKYAFKNNLPAAALCSGFHHAGYSQGGGFCTFNGLIIAAMEVKKAGANNVALLDLDNHLGNGSEDIIRRLNLKWIKHYTVGAHGLRSEGAEQWLEDLPNLIRKKFYDCDVAIVQLGADMAEFDPLGGALSMEQLRKRDRIVFETFKAMGIPISWCLAGGYSKDADGGITPVLQIHRQSVEECCEVYESKNKKAVA